MILVLLLYGGDWELESYWVCDCSPRAHIHDYFKEERMHSNIVFFWFALRPVYTVTQATSMKDTVFFSSVPSHIDEERRLLQFGSQPHRWRTPSSSVWFPATSTKDTVFFSLLPSHIDEGRRLLQFGSQPHRWRTPSFSDRFPATSMNDAVSFSSVLK